MTSSRPSEDGGKGKVINALHLLSIFYPCVYD